MRSILDKLSKDRAYEIAINLKCDGCLTGLASMIYKFIRSKYKWSSSSKVTQKIFKRGKIFARFIDNICAVDLAGMRSLSSKNLCFMYILDVI